MASTYSCNPLGLQANSAYSRGVFCASLYRYAISSGESSKTLDALIDLGTKYDYEYYVTFDYVIEN